MRYRPVETITLTKTTNPETLESANELAKIRDVSVHDLADRLLREVCENEIQQVNPTSSVGGCQE